MYLVRTLPLADSAGDAAAFISYDFKFRIYKFNTHLISTVLYSDYNRLAS